jgi:hypothetical protein
MAVPVEPQAASQVAPLHMYNLPLIYEHINISGMKQILKSRTQVINTYLAIIIGNHLLL